MNYFKPLTTPPAAKYPRPYPAKPPKNSGGKNYATLTKTPLMEPFMPKGQKPYASPSKKLEANADLISRAAAVNRMPESREKMKAQNKLSVDKNERERLFKANGGIVRPSTTPSATRKRKRVTP